MIEDKISNLPSTTALAELLYRCGDASLDTLNQLKGEIKSHYLSLTSLVDDLGLRQDQDFVWEPEELFTHLTSIKLCVGGLQGCVSTLSTKQKSFVLKSLSSATYIVSGKEKTYTDKEKETYAKAETSDLDGLEKSLEKLFSLINDKIYVLKSTVKGNY